MHNLGILTRIVEDGSTSGCIALRFVSSYWYWSWQADKSEGGAIVSRVRIRADGWKQPIDLVAL